MTREEALAIIEYAKRLVEYELASREDGADGYRQTAHAERKAAEAAEADLLRLAR